MKFSVIIPVYNLEGYIIRCLKSFADQNCSEEDLELVIVNDGSTDKSLEIIEDFRQSHPECRISIFSKVNGGLSSARNFGLSKAQGKYIWFVDGDDWVPEDSINKLSGYLDQLPNLDILEFDYELALETREGLKYRYAGNPEAKSAKIESGREFLVDHEYSLGVTVKIFRRNFLTDTELLFPEGKFSEDNIFSLQTLLSAERYYKINDVYYYYYQRQNSITKTKTTEHLRKYYEDIFHNMLEMRRLTKEESSAIRNTIARMCSFFVLLMMMDLFRNKKYELMRFYGKKIKMNNFYPLPDPKMNHINRNKFFFLRMTVNLYLKFL